MNLERAEALIVGVAMIAVVAFLTAGFALAVFYGLYWLLS